MREKDPLDDILNQIGNLLNFAREKAAQPFAKDVPPETRKRLEVLEDMVMKFYDLSKSEREKKGLSDKDVLKLLFQDKHTLPLHEQKIIDKSHQINRDILGMKYALLAAQKQALLPKGKPFDSGKAKKEQSKKRKAKFKRMHGDQTWKKL